MEIGWTWDDEGCLGEFHFVCEGCGKKNDFGTLDLQECKVVSCSKCGKKYKPVRRTYLEPII